MRVRSFRHPYMWGRDHPLVVDSLIAVALAVFGILTELFNKAEEGLREADTRSIVLTLAGTLPLVLRRTYPITVLAVVGTAGLYHTWLGYPGGGPLFGLLFALYAVAAKSTNRAAAVGCVVAICLAATALFAMDIFDSELPDAGIGDMLAIYAFLIAAWVLGDNMRIRRAYVAEVEEKAERLERERDVDAQQAVLRERGRIARELHDIVAHSMSVMLVQAGAARRTLGRGDERSSVEALGHIEETGRQAMAEMRRLVSVLREEGASADRLPQPGIDDVAVLVGHCRDVGLDVTTHTVGDVRPLPSGLELVAYRIVQEALTNTMKHAGPARAEVTLYYGPDVLQVTVCDDGRGAASVPPPEPGHGLAGMRERVAVYGGVLVAGPQPGGGFRVHVDLPLNGVDVPVVTHA